MDYISKCGLAASRSQHWHSLCQCPGLAAFVSLLPWKTGYTTVCLHYSLLQRQDDPEWRPPGKPLLLCFLSSPPLLKVANLHVMMLTLTLFAENGKQYTKWSRDRPLGDPKLKRRYHRNSSWAWDGRCWHQQGQGQGCQAIVLGDVICTSGNNNAMPFSVPNSLPFDHYLCDAFSPQFTLSETLNFMYYPTDIREH